MRKRGSAFLQTGAARYTGCWHLLKKEIALSWELAGIRLVKILLALQADLIPWASDYIYGKSGHRTYVSWHTNLCLIVSQEFNYSQIGTSDLLMMYVVILPPIILSIFGSLNFANIYTSTHHPSIQSRLIPEWNAPSPVILSPSPPLSPMHMQHPTCTLPYSNVGVRAACAPVGLML